MSELLSGMMDKVLLILKNCGTCCASTLALSCAILATPDASSAQSADQCQVTRTSGRVLVERGEERDRLTAGEVVQSGDRIITRSRAQVTIRCTGELAIVVGAQTRIGLDRLLRPEGDAPSTSGIDVFRGIVGFLRPGGRRDGFVVRTPSAVAAVRSTEWTIEVDDNATAAFVRDGVVLVAFAEDTVRLTPGDGVDVAADGSGGPVKQWGQGRIDGQSERLGPDW